MYIYWSRYTNPIDTTPIAFVGMSELCSEVLEATFKKKRG